MENGLDPPLGLHATPAHIKWVHNLKYLLDDGEGVELFKKYLATEGCVDSLNFWFACEGLKKENDAGRIQLLIGLIYGAYILPPNKLRSVSSSTRESIREQITRSESSTDRSKTIFDQARYEEEQFIRRSAYPNFLQSDIYLDYARSMQNEAGDDVCSKSVSDRSISDGSVFSSRSSNDGGSGDDDAAAAPLSTILEDGESIVSSTSSHHLATEKFRVGYGDAVGSIPEDQLHGLMLQNSSKYKPKHINDYANLYFIDRLEQVKKVQEAGENVLAWRNECDQEENSRSTSPLTTMFNATIANIEVSDEESILDDHVSRIWNDSAQHSPEATPPAERRTAPAFSNKSVYQRKHYRKESDLASTISGDSGVIPDYASVGSSRDSSTYYRYNKHGTHHSGKSTKSGTGSAEPLVVEQERRAKECGKRSLGNKYFMNSLSSGIDSGVSMVSGSTSSSVSQHLSPKVLAVLGPLMANNSPQLSQLAEQESFARHERSNHSSLSTATYLGPTNQQSRSKMHEHHFVSSRCGYKEPGVGRKQTTSAAQPKQFITGLHSKSLLPPLNTTTCTRFQGARWRWEDDTKSKLPKSKIPIQERVPDLLVKASVKSSRNTEIVRDSREDPWHSRKNNNNKSLSSNWSDPIMRRVTAPAVEYTVVGYQFGQDVPYISKLAGKNITLKQFKTLITKKDNFRYFFKKVDNDFNTGIVYEEIGRDDEVLPLWEGKLFAKLEIKD